MMSPTLTPMPSGPFADGVTRWPVGRAVSVPCRIDFIGGWSDQPECPFPGAVLNAAIGWEGRDPLQLSASGALTSDVSGIGTGLGISSILEAARYLQRYPWAKARYVRHVLDYEAFQGTRGGWQDQVGGIEGGFKLVESADHETVTVTRRDDHPLMQHVVLFDTGIRRPAKAIGDRVRALLTGTGRTPVWFRSELAINVSSARRALEATDVTATIKGCLAAWQVLCGFVPEMGVPLPAIDHTYGAKLCGAGGGGYGIYFAREPEARGAVVAALRERGLWAVVPELRPGLQYLPAEELRALPVTAALPEGMPGLVICPACGMAFYTPVLDTVQPCPVCNAALDVRSPD